MGIHDRDYMKDRPLDFEGDRLGEPSKSRIRIGWKQVVVVVLLVAMVVFALLGPD